MVKGLGGEADGGGGGDRLMRVRGVHWSKRGRVEVEEEVGWGGGNGSGGRRVEGGGR